MSRETGRETDRSSSGAQGRGGAAYPSGTTPYGLRPGQEAADEPASAPPEEPKTETTLTTRIRINIPGSRPIPPVVVRKPVGDAPSGAGADTGAVDHVAAERAAAEAVRPEPVPVPAPEPFAPAEPARPAQETQEPGKPASDWFAPRKASAAPPRPAAEQAAPAGPRALAAGPSAPAPAPVGAPGFTGSASDGVPSTASTTQSMPVVTTAMTGGPGHTPAQGTPVFDPAAALSPYDDGPGSTPVAGTPVIGGPAAPTGPTAGPVTGDSRVTAAPAGPGAGPSLGGAYQGGAAPRMSDDTAILTPQPPAPVPGPVGAPVGGMKTGRNAPAGGADRGNVSGATLNSGVPAGAEPAPRPTPASTAKPVKKRSKLMLACVGVVGLGAVAYGAGLLVDHADVPKGTTVLGVDIGGGTKEEAVAELDATLGKRAHAPLQVNIAGKTVELSPDKAGLALDTQETVRGAAGSDYNPVSVVGALFGGRRVAQPVFPIDEEKLAVALTDLAGASGSVREGGILFEPGKATPVEGKEGQGLDVQRSLIAVKDAYRAKVETGSAGAVELPVVTRKPTITKAEVDRAMEEFAQPAMSARITISAGGKSIDFGPNKSLPKILSMKAVDGRLVEVYDKNAIDELLDGVFDGVMITKGDGTKHQVNADDVAAVMGDALRGKTKSERTKTIDLSGNG